MKRLFTLICLAALVCSCSQKNAMNCGNEILLAEGWTLSAEGDGNAYTAIVPSTVAGTLYDNGFFPENLFAEENYKKVDKSIFDKTWTYETRFKVAKKAPHFELRFDGISYYADIWLNGVQIASADTTSGVFIVRRYDVTNLLEKENTLKVSVKRAQKGDLNIGFVDWNPKPVDESMGIVQPVHLHATGAVTVEDVYVKPLLDVKSLKSADLEVMVTLRNNEPEPVQGTLEILLEDTRMEVPYSVEANAVSEITLTPAQASGLHIDNPRVWWSRDLGTPELYDITVNCLASGSLSDSRSATFGIRDIKSRITAEGHRQFTLNGKDILIKGAGWTDDIFLRDTPASLERQVQYVADMNMNCIRFENIWGKDDTIYDLCDKYGLLAMVGWSCQWEWEDYCGVPEQGFFGSINTPELMDLAVKYFHDQVIRLHNHPSIFTWLTGSDGIPNPELDTRYLEIFNRYDYRPYVCSAKELTSVVSGPSGTKMAGPYDYVGPEYWYFNTTEGGAFGFNTETCAGASVAQKESLFKMFDKDKLWPVSDYWNYHCTASGTSMGTFTTMPEVADGNYGTSSSLDEFLMKAYAVDYNGIRGMFEAFRACVPSSTGIIQWMLNSAWPSNYWQVYDWYGAPTAGYYGVKKACEPVQLIFNYKDRKVYAVNETGSACKITANVTILDKSSAVIASEDAQVEVAYRTPAAVFDLAKYDGKPHFVALTLTRESGEKVDNFYCIAAKDNVHDWKNTQWFITPIKEYADQRFAFPEDKADVSFTTAAVEGGIEVTLTNNSDRVVYMNILKAKNAAGELVIPAFWSDNFLPLLPKEVKTVSCRINGSVPDVKIELEAR